MEAETQVSDDITLAGDNPSRPDHWVAPEVAAALAGEIVDFGKDLTQHDNTDA